jgi:hypothetical protein
MLGDKELDEFFRQGFKGAEFPVDPGAWAKAEELIQQSDPLALDNFVKAKFAQASFPMNQSSWLKAAAMINGAYRAIFIKNVLAGVFVVATLSSALWYMTNRNTETSIKYNPEETIFPVSLEDDYMSSPFEIRNKNAELEITRGTNEKGKSGATTLAPAGSSKAKNSGKSASNTSTYAQNEGGEENKLRVAYPRAPFMPELPTAELFRESVDEIHLIKFEEEEAEKFKADASAFRCIPGTSHYIGVLMGVAGSNTFEGNNPNTGMSSSPVIGLRYALMLQQRWTINANILYQHRAGTNQSLVYESYEYNFGMDTVTNYLTPSRLHYLELPVYASYQIGRNHKVSLGAYASWLVTTNSYKDVYINSAMNTQEHFESQEYGMVEALRQWDYGVMLGYEFRLHENLQAGLRFQYGIPDLTKEGYFPTEQKDRIMWIKLVLEYRLSR